MAEWYSGTGPLGVSERNEGSVVSYVHIQMAGLTLTHRHSQLLPPKEGTKVIPPSPPTHQERQGLKCNNTHTNTSWLLSTLLNYRTQQE